MKEGRKARKASETKSGPLPPSVQLKVWATTEYLRQNVGPNACLFLWSALSEHRIDKNCSKFGSKDNLLIFCGFWFPMSFEHLQHRKSDKPIKRLRPLLIDHDTELSTLQTFILNRTNQELSSTYLHCCQIINTACSLTSSSCLRQ